MAIAEELKLYMAEAMKIDTAPWVNACTEVDMEELYSELSLQKLKNKPTYTQNINISDYRELFQETENEPEHNGGEKNESKIDRQKKSVQIGQKRGKKVLCKGGPGMGKTTLMKKIGWDWAKGTFIQFHIVFFVFLKFVQPGEAIENIVVQQNPILEGMNVVPIKVKKILEAFGSKCLLILDGLDEHALGQNQDVLKIIKGQKLLYCNILVTSRPHGCANIEQHFQTIVRVNGFTRNHAERFALRILENKSKVESVVNFNPWGKSGFGFENEFLYSCPILLLILCVLVKDDMVDLDNENLSKGELYFSFIQVLYKKYASSNDMSFNQNVFEDVVKKLGKLAWETLQTGNPFLTRNQMIAEVGQDAFKYGILIGHEDIRLLTKVKADILVTFVHRTVQEFLGAFHFILRLCEGDCISNLLGTSDKPSRLLSENLFLHFCLWCVFQREISLPNQELAYKAMIEYVLPKLDMVQFEIDVIGHVFPALDLREGMGRNDKLIVNFFCDIISRFSRVKCLSLKTDYAVSQLTCKLFNPSLQSLSRIILRDDEWSFSMITARHDDCFSSSRIGRMAWLELVNHFHYDGDLDIVHHQTCEKPLLDPLLAKCRSLAKRPSVYLFPQVGDKIELSDFLQQNVKKLFVANVYGSSVCCSGDIKLCPELTHLYLIGAFKDAFDFKVSSALSMAVNKDNFPKLTHLSFEDSRYGLKGRLHLLFQCTWQSLTELNVKDCYLHLPDFEALSSAYENGLVPRLKTLSVGNLYGFYASEIYSVFKSSWISITSLSLTNLCTGAAQTVCKIIREGKLPSIENLAVSMGRRQQQYQQALGESLEIVSTLESIAVHYFALDLTTLDKVVNKLKLKILDICDCTGVAGNLCVLIMGQPFTTLKSLSLSQCGLTSDDLRSLAKGNVEDKFPVLRHLDISMNPEYKGHLECLFDFSCAWDNLLALNVQQHCIRQEYEATERVSNDLEVLFCQVEAGCLGNVEEISLTIDNFLSIYQTVPWKHLKTMDILASTDEILKVIVKIVDNKLFPSLEVISVNVSDTVPYTSNLTVKEAKYTLAKSGIYVYIFGTSREERYKN